MGYDLIIGLCINVATIVSAVGVFVFKLGRAVERFEAVGEQQSREITELKNNMRTIADVMTKVALQTERQNTFDQRMGRAEELIDDLRRGEGYILPLKPRA